MSLKDALAAKKSRDTDQKTAAIADVTKEPLKRLNVNLPESVMKQFKANGIPVLIYEPTLDKPDFQGSKVTHDLADFKAHASVIVANRWNNDLADADAKVYTRDLFRRD